MEDQEFTIEGKALEVNLNPRIFGTFAEIGAGQEVVRNFFQAGGAAGTIAKAISAYDMTFSDEIYGRSGRYVSKERLHAMLDHEYSLLMQRLSPKRGHETMFFAFADTVSARNYHGTNECHGWMGIRFQRTPLTQPNDIVIHVRMTDRSNALQSEALGSVGVNLIHSAFFCEDISKDFVQSLLDGLSKDRIEVDMIEVNGPDFRNIDNRLMSLQLVKTGLTNAAMFAPCGKVLQPSEVLYKKPILVERGSFRPITNLHLDMLNTAKNHFVKETLKKDQECVVLAELTLNNLMSSGDIDMQDFLARVDMISSLGFTVLISNYSEFYRLVSYFRRYTKEPIALTVGVNALLELFNEKHYENLEGGILEALGRMFKNDVKLLVYPMARAAFDAYVKLFNPPHDTADLGNATLITGENLPVHKHQKLLYFHLLAEDRLVPLEGYARECLSLLSRDILRKIAGGDSSWEELVPKPAAELIKTRKLLGYRSEVPEPEAEQQESPVETVLLETEEDRLPSIH